MKPMRPMHWQDESIAPALPSDPSSVVTEPERPVGRSPRRPSGRNTPRRVLSKTGATAEGYLRRSTKQWRKPACPSTKASAHSRIESGAPYQPSCAPARPSPRIEACWRAGGTRSHPHAACNDQQHAPSASFTAAHQDLACLACLLRRAARPATTRQGTGMVRAAGLAGGSSRLRPAQERRRKGIAKAPQTRLADGHGPTSALDQRTSGGSLRQPGPQTRAPP